MRVLLVRAGALGDILLLRRAAASLRQAGHTVALLAPGPDILGSEAPKQPWESASALFADGPAHWPFGAFDAAIAYSRSPELRKGLAAHVPRVIVHDPAPPAGHHASAWLAAPLAALGVPVLDRLPHPEATAEETQAAARLLALLPPAYLAVHPGSGSPRKNWPAENFAAVIAGCAADEPWLLIEGPADGGAASALRELPGAVVAFNLPPRVLGAVLARAGVYVGNDSGVSHLAAAWGAPAVVLFGPTDPARWSPVGERVQIVTSANGAMDGIAAGGVIARAAVRRG